MGGVVTKRAYTRTNSGQTKKSNATSGFCCLELGKRLKRKPARLLGQNVMKIVLGKKITRWESLGMSISKFPGHMRSTKLTFSATVLTLDLKEKIFENLRLLSERPTFDRCVTREGQKDHKKS